MVGGLKNRTSFIDGLQQSVIDASYQIGAYTSATSNAAAIGVRRLDALSAPLATPAYTLFVPERDRPPTDLKSRPFCGTL